MRNPYPYPLKNTVPEKRVDWTRPRSSLRQRWFSGPLLANRVYICHADNCFQVIFVCGIVCFQRYTLYISIIFSFPPPTPTFQINFFPRRTVVTCGAWILRNHDSKKKLNIFILFFSLYKIRKKIPQFYIVESNLIIRFIALNDHWKYWWKKSFAYLRYEI